MLLLLFNFVYSQYCIRQMGCNMFVVNINTVHCMCYMLCTFYSLHFVLWDLVFIVQLRLALYHFKLPWMPWSGQLAVIYSHTVKAILYWGEWWISFKNLHPFVVLFGQNLVWDLHIRLLNSSEFHKNCDRAGWSFLTGISEIYMYSTCVPWKHVTVWR